MLRISCGAFQPLRPATCSESCVQLGRSFEILSKIDAPPVCESRGLGGASQAIESPRTEAGSEQIGPYRVIRKLGEGGMGQLLLATSGTVPAHLVVIKRVRPGLSSQQLYARRFIDEIRVASRMRHPRLVQVVSVGRHFGQLYFAMEYAPGVTAHRLVAGLRARGTPLPIGLALLLCEQVCEGLDYLHQVSDERGTPLQCVHRDVSPANICITRTGSVKLIDFGAADSVLKAEHTAPRILIGNLTYMAPEQARKRVVDGRADVYSVGAMLWEWVAWSPIPLPSHSVDRWRRAARPTWRLPSAFRPEVPGRIDAAVMRALEVDAAARFQSAREFMEVVRELRLALYPEAHQEELAALVRDAFPASDDDSTATGSPATLGNTAQVTSRKWRRWLLLAALLAACLAAALR